MPKFDIILTIAESRLLLTINAANADAADTHARHIIAQKLVTESIVVIPEKPQNLASLFVHIAAYIRRTKTAHRL